MDDSDIDTIVWPDTSALAERLWSRPADDPEANPQAFDISAATLRLIPHRCRMYQRGIRAKPVDDRDGFGRRRLQEQYVLLGFVSCFCHNLPSSSSRNRCETILPPETAKSLPPLSHTGEL